MKLLLALLTLLLIGQGALAQLADRDYPDLLSKSIQFFEAQACGPKPAFSSFDWRGDCHLTDGQDVGLDLTGGWHDAGDHPKFNFPLGAAVYKLASLYVDYRPAVDATGNKDRLLNQLRFIGDYMIKCHPEPNTYVIQVGEGEVDHRFWQVPENNTYERMSFVANEDQPATDLACVNAAAFAALSMAFAGEDATYSTELLQHARDLYSFGTTYPGTFTNHIPEAEVNFYGSNDSTDAIMLGAIWLHRATGEQSYLDEARAGFSAIGRLQRWVPSFRDHDHEAFLQLAKVTGDTEVLDSLDVYVNEMIDEDFGSYTPAGLWRPADRDIFNVHRGIDGVSVAYRYTELIDSSNPTYDKAREFVFNQMNYILGDNPEALSYVVDFGDDFPTRTHHRAAHSPINESITNPEEDTHTLTGALMAGPDRNDVYSNNRRIVGNTEPTVRANAALALMATALVKETEPEAGTDDIAYVVSPAAVVPGTPATVSVRYSASTDRDIIVTFQQDSAPFQLFGRAAVDVPAGVGTVDIEVPIGAEVPLANDAYQFQVFITTDGGTFADRLDNIAKNNVNAVSDISEGTEPVESVSIVECPSFGLESEETVALVDRVEPADAANKNVTWSSSDTAVAVVSDNGIVTGVSAGVAIVTITTEEGGFTDSCAVEILAGSTAITDLIAPSFVIPGQEVIVTVFYEAVNSRDLVVNFQLDTLTFGSFGITRVNVPAGSGSVDVTIPVSEETPIVDDDYQFQAFIIPVGGTFPDRFDSRALLNVDVVASLVVDVSIDSLALPIDTTGAYINTYLTLEPTGASLIYSSSDSTVFTVDESGLISPLSPGAGYLTVASADYPTVTDSVLISITEVADEILTGKYKLINKFSGLAMALDLNPLTNGFKLPWKAGANVHQWKDDDQRNKVWDIVPSEEEGYYQLVNQYSQKVLALDLNFLTNGFRRPQSAGANVYQWLATGEDNTLWSIEESEEEGYYVLVNKFSGKVLALNPNFFTNGFKQASEPGANIHQANATDSDYTLWRLEAVEEEIMARRDHRKKKGQVDLVEEATLQELTVYPNPVQDRLSVLGAEALSGEVRILNLEGKQMMYHELNEHQLGEMDVSALPAGLYILEVQRPGEARWRTKIVKQ